MVGVALCVAHWNRSQEAGSRVEWKEESGGHKELGGLGRGWGPRALLKEGVELQ